MLYKMGGQQMIKGFDYYTLGIEDVRQTPKPCCNNEGNPKIFYQLAIDKVIELQKDKK